MRSRSKMLASGFWLAAAMLASAVAANEARVMHKPVTSFGYLDSNKDARISRDEANADWAVQHRFAEADANRDGFLTAEEFKRLSRQEKPPADLSRGEPGAAAAKRPC